MTLSLPPRAAFGLLALSLTFVLTTRARGEDASAWQRAAHSAVRLLA
jgi:hypothetical protein